MNGWAYYQTKELAVVPYMPGTPAYNDGVLPDLYLRTKAEGNIERVFHEDGFGMDAFVAHFHKLKTLQLLCRVKDDKTLVPMGYCWVDMPSGVDGSRSAIAAFCFFKEARRVCLDLGRLGIAYWVIDLCIDILHGVILDWNLPAVHYAERLGFRQVARVPNWRYVNGLMTGVRVMQMEKADFLPGFNEWFEGKRLPAPQK